MLHPKPTANRPIWRRYCSEFIGTFFVVYGACGAVISDVVSNGALGLAGVAAVPGLMVMAMIFALGPLSGAHFNPAVTVALAVSKRFPWRQVVPYISMQTIGAVLASAMHSVLYGQATAKDAEFGAHIPKVAYSAAFGFEVIYGFLLMLVIMAVATNRQVAAPIPAIAIGLTVTLLIYIGGPLSGGSMNPVRSLAPALFTGGAALNALPIYLFAPLVGSVLAALLYEKLRDEPDDAQSVPANS